MKKNSMKVVLGAMALAVMLAPLVSTHAQTPAQTLGPVTGNAATGKVLYYNHGCYGCHGFNGETSRRLVGSTTGILNNETSFTNFLRARADVAPILPSSAMPNYPANALSDQEVKHIYAYIRSFRNVTPELKDIPTLNAIVAAASRPYKP